MFQDKYVFAQLTAFLNRTQFNNYVRKYDGNRYVKHFTCWNQLLAKLTVCLTLCEHGAPAETWCTIDGHRLDTKPTAPSVYILNGQKVIIK